MTFRTFPHYYYTAASVNVNTGDTPVGSLSDLQTRRDGNVYQVPETATTPGFDIQVGFEDVKRVKLVEAVLAYVGATAHYVELQIYDWDSPQWVSIGTAGTVVNTGHLVGYQFQLDPGETSAYVAANGAATIRVYHPVAGDATHDVYIDYVGLAY